MNVGVGIVNEDRSVRVSYWESKFMFNSLALISFLGFLCFHSLIYKLSDVEQITDSEDKCRLENVGMLSVIWI